MADWDPARVSCSITWYVLGVLDQSDRSADRGDVKVQDFTFWTSNSTARDSRAQTLSVQMDNIFRSYYHAIFEAGKTRQRAIDAMFDVLTTRDQTMADLADAVDEHYRFFGE